MWASPGWACAVATQPIASRAAHQPGPSWMPESESSDGDLPPAESESDVDGGRQRQPDRQRSVDGGAQVGVGGLELVADREGGWLSGRGAAVFQRLGQEAVQPTPIGNGAGTHHVTDECRAQLR
jgi:hypothetical protein